MTILKSDAPSESESSNKKQDRRQNSYSCRNTQSLAPGGLVETGTSGCGRPSSMDGNKRKTTEP